MHEPTDGRLPGHGTVVAYVALFAALATGGAYAAAQIGSDDIKGDAVRSKHIKAKQVKAGDIAQGAGVEAIALTEGGDQFSDDFPPQGFESITNEETGVYCITPSGNLDPVTDPPVITVEYSNSTGDNFTAAWDDQSAECTEGQYEVLTFDAATGNPTDGAAFVIMVP